VLVIAILMIDASFRPGRQRERAFTAHGPQRLVITAGEGRAPAIVFVEGAQEDPEHGRLDLVEA
jgi:hypothetical protein